MSLAAPALPGVLLKVSGAAELTGMLGWAGRFNLWGRITPSEVLSRKHLVFPLHESGCHLSLPAAIAIFNGCSPSQGIGEPDGKGRHPQWCHCCPEGSLGAAKSTEPTLAASFASLLHTESPSLGL